MVIPEPVTAVTTAGALLGLLVSTIKSTFVALSDAESAIHDLEAYKSRFDGYVTKITHWKAHWLKDRTSLSEGRCLRLWGQTGGNHIVRLLRDVETAATDLGKEFNAKRTRVGGVADITVLRRVAFALLGKKERISTATGRLKEALNELWEQSAYYYNEQRGDRGAGSLPKAENISEMSTLHKRSTTLVDAMAEIYRFLSAKTAKNSERTSRWGLLMTRLEQYTDPQILVGDRHAFLLFSSRESLIFDFDFDFNFQPRGSNSIIGSLLPCCSPQDEPVHLGRNLTTVISRVRDIARIMPSVEHSQPILRDHESTKRHRLYEELMGTSATETALRIAAWSIFLWGTPWAAKICNCQVFEAKARMMPINERKTADNSHVSICPRQDDCDLQHGSGIAGEPLSYLGTVLIELALMGPLPVSSVQTSSLHRPGLMNKVANATSKRYRSAVEFCVYGWRRSNNLYGVELSRADSMRVCTQEIVAKLYSHHELHAAHYRRHPRLK
ncbi:hypothetical protein LTR56_003639 [Elasticomyces elasticus]|nr:hypothetical protein LTR56_003639 [Elasticomyces elasticus]KAK3663772.1 hypothetical protein LTR22_005473 [Elasticomyces elasticus]KAK4927291.1 hypothetical protein LTR49_005956 [Elasticomyces elasticus]KAK5767303.1 hypothetical protein LTS12_002456 [Elasticomyces elasticus]